MNKDVGKAFENFVWVCQIILLTLKDRKHLSNGSFILLSSGKEFHLYKIGIKRFINSCYLTAVHF